LSLGWLRLRVMRGRTPRSRIGVSPVVTEGLLTSMAVAIGIVLMLVSHSWAASIRAGSLDQTNKEIAQQWSLLLVEHAVLSDDGSSATVYVSNPGKYELVVLRCVVYPRGAPPPTFSFDEHLRVQSNMSLVVPLTCPVYGAGPSSSSSSPFPRTFTTLECHRPTHSTG